MIDEKLLKEARQAIIEQNKDKAVELARQLLSEGMDGMELMNQAFIPAISEVGDQFGRGLLFLPELVQSADAMQAVTDLINESLPANDAKRAAGKLVIATVKGDVHDIGKCIVVSLMQANGLTVYDLGRDVDTDHIVEEAVRLDLLKIALEKRNRATDDDAIEEGG